MTLEQLKAEKEFIGDMTLNEYIRASRTGMKLSLTRANRKYIHANIDDMIAHITSDSRTMGQLRNDKANPFYDAICSDRDEVMLETA